MQELHKTSYRIWELDFARGIMILLMVLYHWLFDITEFFNLNFISFNRGFFKDIVYFFVVFMLVSGISSTFSRSNVKRGFLLLGVALLISLVSYLIAPDLFIQFGILHFFAICMIAWPLYKNLDWKWLLALAAVIGALGVWFATIRTDLAFLFPLGITAPGFFSGDYFPLFPWAGVYLVGVALGKTVYAKRRSLLKKELKPGFINYAGRYSLWIYVLHQPIGIGILWIVSLIFHLPFRL